MSPLRIRSAAIPRSHESHRIDDRQVIRQAAPVVAAVIGDVEVAGGGAECQGVAGLVQRVAEDEVVAVFLGQAGAQILPGLAAVVGAADDQPARSTGTRYSALTAGATQATRSSSSSTASAKPKPAGPPFLSEMSRHCLSRRSRCGRCRSDSAAKAHRDSTGWRG